MNETRRPSFQFYPQDWTGSTKLQSCSLESQGFWIKFLCKLHDSDVYGKFCFSKIEPNDIANDIANIKISSTICSMVARVVGIGRDESARCLNELINAKVIKIDTDGYIFSSRMMRDEHIRNIRQLSGSKGGAKSWKKNYGQNDGQNEFDFAKPNSLAKVKQTVEEEEEEEKEEEGVNEVKGGVGENLKVRFEKFKGSILKNTYWCDEVCMKTRSKPEELPAMIDNFISHCILGGENHETENEFKRHFRNACLRNLAIVKPQIIKPIDERKEEFRLKVEPYSSQYDPKMLEAFFIHWSQFDEKTNLLAFEKEKAFEIPNKLASWKENNKNFTKNGKITRESVGEATRNFKFGGKRNP